MWLFRSCLPISLSLWVTILFKILLNCCFCLKLLWAPNECLQNLSSRLTSCQNCLTQIQIFRVSRSGSLSCQVWRIVLKPEPCTSPIIPSLVSLLQPDVVLGMWIAPPYVGWLPAKQAGCVDKQKDKKKKIVCKSEKQPVLLALLSSTWSVLCNSEGLYVGEFSYNLCVRRNLPTKRQAISLCRGNRMSIKTMHDGKNVWLKKRAKNKKHNLLEKKEKKKVKRFDYSVQEWTGLD